MEYDFLHDAITGNAKAIFSTEHEVMGPWLEVEVGMDASKLTQLLTAIDEIEKGFKNEILISGSEYSVILDQDDVSIETNSSMNGADALPIELQDEHVDFDSNNSSQCGLEDFREVLMAWAKFIKS
ncbi:YacL family protein [Thalassotalea sp. PLHSN55]|uniref:UPF0231 family protein n=1 Tax=Thalassotalea sp. PLHSN55 TaxID=3435888 RepID=UPI003F843152